MKKKGLLGLVLCAMLVAPVAGCNKDKVEGVYEFDSFRITVDDETKYYICSASDMSKSDFVAEACESMKRGEGEPQWKLEDDKAYYYSVDKDGNEIEDFDSVEFEYKIEDDKFKLKEDNTDKYLIYGTYEDEKIIQTKGFPAGVAVIFKKN